MGRISLFIQQGLILFALIPLTTLAKRVDGVLIPDSFECGGKNLPLKATALRTATFLSIRVYIIAYYGESKITGMKDADEVSRPLCFVVTYLRDVDNDDADKAWKFQFKESSNFPYPALDAHVKILQDSFGEIKGQRQHVFSFTKDKTDLFENGNLRGEIRGKEFQKNFISIWYGTKPPTKEVQEQLLE